MMFVDVNLIAQVFFPYVKSAPAQELVAGSKNTRADAQEMDSFYTNKVQKL